MSCMRHVTYLRQYGKMVPRDMLIRSETFTAILAVKISPFLRVSVMVYMKGVTHREDENVYDECVGFGGWILGFD